MVKYVSNCSNLTSNDLKANNVTTCGKYSINGKTYIVTKIEKSKWRNVEWIGRRFLGGFLAIITLGLFFIYKPFANLFTKTKTIHVTAILKSNTLSNPTLQKTNAKKIAQPPNVGTCKTLEQLTCNELAHLQILDLRERKDLIQLPDLSGLTNLRMLDLGGCDALEQLRFSKLTSLQILDLDRCQSLKQLPNLNELANLQILNLGKCTALRQLELHKLTRLQAINLEECSALKQLSLIKLPNLQKLILSKCKTLEQITLNGLTSLQKLDLWKCKALKRISLHELPNLQTLNLVQCTSLKQLPDLSKLTNLQTLNLGRCTALRPDNLKTALDQLKANQHVTLALSTQDCDLI